MKEVIQLDRNGIFVGFSVADESPLEPGVLLMPADSVDVAPPTFKEGFCHRWTGLAWEEIKIEQSQTGQDEFPDAPVQSNSMKRALAYREESDPIFFKEQRGEVPAGTWLASVAAIKARY